LGEAIVVGILHFSAGRSSVMAVSYDVPLYINGRWVQTANTLPIINPADETVVGNVSVADVAELEAAIDAATTGFRVWSKTSPWKRNEVILTASALLRERAEEIARAITIENGKPLHEARMEVIRGCEFFEWDAGEAVRSYGRVIPSETGIRYMVVHEPIGTVAAFSPWNFPMSQPARKIAGAIASGCSVIMKASEETPSGVIHIARAFEEAGLPPGVLNLVFGVPSTISEFLIPQSQVKLVAFTGSTVVGKHLTEMAARYIKPALMELGGHAPVIVCDDVDPEWAGTMSASRKYRNSGQVCTSPTRFYVHERIYSKFVRAFTEKARALRVGDGMESGTEMGPVANDRRIATLESMVEDAVGRGAKLLCGGVRLRNSGYFFAPTALAEVPDDALALREEPFGPLAIINPVSSIDEALEKANALPFGLAAYGFAKSADNVDRLARGIEAGNVSINTLEASRAETPFGGVKESGLGREGGAEGLHHYSVVKTISHALGAPSTA
jgi:succinate-semialdehyde dehydrogenase / glutarate-semialdehyde dehydrogenase